MQELPVINRTQELYENVSKITNKLPALQRQTIGRRLENSVLQLLELLIMAKYAPTAHKGPYLIKASAQAEIVQFQLRILLNGKLANETTLHQLQAKVVEIGRMLGGWRKSTQQ
ncbi:MAG: four helix bundle protein [Candidatus Saccharimonadales bacterium]